MYNTWWWIVKFNNRVDVTQLDKVPTIPYVGPYWNKLDALRKLDKWGYGLSSGMNRVKK